MDDMSKSTQTKHRPNHLVITAVFWIFSIALSLASLIWYWSAVSHPFLWLLINPLLGAGVLWFYWNGYSWARYFVMVTSILSAIDAFYTLSGLHILTYIGAEAAGGRVLNICRLCFNLYLVVWLFTSEASRYFSTEARHERQSQAVEHLRSVGRS
jgi:hypothetical protein